jgi:beta-xylosidase
VVLGTVAESRQAMRNLGLGAVPLAITEFGWTTSPRGNRNWAPEILRPGYILQSLGRLGHTDCNIAMTVYYTWMTPQRNPANPEDWFGIHPPGGGDSPDSRAFTAALAAARAAPASRLCG